MEKELKLAADETKDPKQISMVEPDKAAAWTVLAKLYLNGSKSL